MTGTENDKQSKPENESGPGGEGSASPSSNQEEVTRIGTKTDIREVDAQKSEAPADDRMRDGT